MDSDKKVKALFNSSVEPQRIIGFCHFHKAGITKEQMLKKECLNKQCDALEKLNPEYWEKREKQKELKKAWQKARKQRLERRNRLNMVIVVGRLTADPKLTFGGVNNTAIAKFSLAVQRDGKDKGADFINCTAFGKTAELIEKYVTKGQMLGVQGEWRTGSYEKDGRKIYTNDCTVNRIEFLSKGEKKKDEDGDIPSGFTHLDDIVPF